ncbi:probable assembly chaperone of rpl4 [Mizuhopecten yessoensis]|uniref:UPF0661 TPR repeat-containing protein C16D10.01c n=1 Tax=Mizuhopecten yessoensis TaxID=6573 RepID=A0A210PEK5_MIZYE|nr:probable assembly chaperone of rpl4 [Mizuhopecten yessoensis]OWF34891.1 UPF0661 TPR repeat-containing protein C16D10.01c [Mizuhopecten yessoensis]
MGKRKFKKSVEGSLVERRRRIQQAKREVALESKGKSPKYSVEQLLEKAEDCIDRFEYELAQKFCQRALEMEPDSILALETTGSLLLELGNQEAAKQCFGRAVEVCPNQGHSKYMYLGQLFEGAQAVQCFQKGIELMMKEHEAKQASELAAACGGGPREGVSCEEICNAYLSLAELYMTDCCMEEDADKKCEHNINQALAIDGDNAEAYQMMASYHLSKENEEMATEMIKKSVSLWLPKYKAADKGEVPDEEFNPLELTPLSYDTRIAAAKILTEVKEYETAVDVLEGLLDENDEVPQVWYMIGWANYLQGPDYKENARYYLQQAKQVYDKIKCDDPDLLKHVEELTEEIGPGEEEGEEEGAEEDVNELDSDSDDETDNKTNGEAMEH